MDFSEAGRRFRWLETQRRIRRISMAQYRAALAELRVYDTAGRLWMLQEITGRWHVYDGALGTDYPPHRFQPVARPAHHLGQSLAVAFLVLGVLALGRFGVAGDEAAHPPRLLPLRWAGRRYLALQQARILFESEGCRPAQITGRIIADSCPSAGRCAPNRERTSSRQRF